MTRNWKSTIRPTKRGWEGVAAQHHRPASNLAHQRILPVETERTPDPHLTLPPSSHPLLLLIPKVSSSLSCERVSVCFVYPPFHCFRSDENKRLPSLRPARRIHDNPRTRIRQAEQARTAQLITRRSSFTSAHYNLTIAADPEHLSSTPPPPILPQTNS